MKKIYAIIITLLLSVSSIITTYAASNPEVTPSGIKKENLEEFIDSYVDDYIGKSVAGASVVVIKDSNIIFSKGYGYADLENNVLMNSKTTLIEWGSVSKLFVWTSVMQLVEQGKIDLHADIRNYLPEGFITKLKYDKPITMLHLMHHNAGFEDNIFDLGFPVKEKVTTLEEGLRIAEPKQIYEPGEVVSYSNYSTALAGYIVERITGQHFYDYITNHILSPLGMKQTIPHEPVWKEDHLLSSKATGYQLLSEGQFMPSIPWYISLHPCGAINGTAEDLAKFAIALMPHDDEQNVLFQSNETLHEMLSQSYSVMMMYQGMLMAFGNMLANIEGSHMAEIRHHSQQTFISFLKKNLQ